MMKSKMILMTTFKESMGHVEREMSSIPMRKREECKKAFQDVVNAVDGFLVRHGYPKPKLHAERFGYLFELEHKNHAIAEVKLLEKFGARYGKHEACVYWGIIDLAEEEVTKSKKLVKVIESLSK